MGIFTSEAALVCVGLRVVGLEFRVCRFVESPLALYMISCVSKHFAD